MIPATLWWVLSAQDAPHRATVYLSIDGATVSPGIDNAVEGTASCVTAPVDVPAHGIEQVEEIAEAARALLAPYGVRVRWGEPLPRHLPHAVVHLGGDPVDFGLEPLVQGVSCEIDCADRNPRNTAFAFTGKVLGASPTVAARVVVHEAAHAFGLEHVLDRGDVMTEFVDDGTLAWKDECLPLRNSTPVCGVEHARACPEGGQNSHRELLARFGTGEADTIAPTVTIVSPTDGERFVAGDLVRLEVEVNDDHAGFGWKFTAPELGWEHVAFAGETELELVVPTGTIAFEVEAIDHDLNRGSAAVTIEVAEEGEGGEPRCAVGGGSHRWLTLAVAVAFLARRRGTKPRRRSI